MQNACMNKHIHIRDFDGKLHAKLAKKAEESGLSLTQFLKQELAKVAARPSQHDFYKQLRNLPAVESPVSAVELIREDRDRR